MKVFSAKERSIEFTYEFLDGKGVEVTAVHLTSKQQENIVRLSREEAFGSIKETLRLQLARTDKKLVEKIIKEQYESGDLIVFSNEIAQLPKEVKEKK